MLVSVGKGAEAEAEAEETQLPTKEGEGEKRERREAKNKETHKIGQRKRRRDETPQRPATLAKDKRKSNPLWSNQTQQKKQINKGQLAKEELAHAIAVDTFTIPSV